MRTTDSTSPAAATRQQGAIRLFRVWGIDVFLHWSWLLVGAIELQTRTNTYHAFVSTNGAKMQDLNKLIPPRTGWVLLEANGINDAGQIVGDGTIHGQTHAFLLTPQ